MQFAPDVRFPTGAQLSVVGVANTAGGTAQAGTAAAVALTGAGFARAQVNRWVKRCTGSADQGLGLPIPGFGLGDGLVGVVEFFDQAVELLVAVQLPPGATGQRIAGISLSPAFGLLVLRRFHSWRALVVRAD